MSSKVYRINPPPKDKGAEPLFRVVYVIDVNAPDALEAAKLTHKIMTDPDSLPPVLEVISRKGKVTRIDLSKEK
ncbi:MAG: hypothetical protein ABIL62_02600 [Planctomycetota bacterium]